MTRGLKIAFVLLLLAMVAVNMAAGWLGKTAMGMSLLPTGTWALVAWLVTIAALAASFGTVGKLPTGNPPISDWKCILIDQRNRISLSRFQVVLWSVLVISAVISEGIVNAMWTVDQPLNLAIPSALWVLLGMSAGSAVVAPAVLSTKGDQLQTKALGAHAWSDMFYGDDKANSDQVDFSKVQQFFLTVVLVVAYAVQIGATMAAGAKLTFPQLDPGFLGLMAVSQVTYIAYKALPQNKTDASAVEP